MFFSTVNCERTLRCWEHADFLHGNNHVNGVHAKEAIPWSCSQQSAAKHACLYSYDCCGSTVQGHWKRLAVYRIGCFVVYHRCCDHSVDVTVRREMGRSVTCRIESYQSEKQRIVCGWRGGTLYSIEERTLGSRNMKTFSGIRR